MNSILGRIPVRAAIAAAVLTSASLAFLHAADAGGLLLKVTSGDVANSSAQSHGVAWGDYDGDGRTDLIVANVGPAPLLFHNQADGPLIRVTTGDLPNQGTWSTFAAWADYDNDGHLDLLLSRNGAPHQVWQGHADGSLTLNTTSGLTATEGQIYGGAWVDYDNDGWVDIYLTSAFAPSALFHNNQNGTFTRVYPEGMAGDILPTVGCAWGDYDNDGLPDLFLAEGGFSAFNVLYHNLGGGRFERVLDSFFADYPGSFTCCAWGDYDNDGYLDLVVARRGAGGNLLFHNNRNGTFTFEFDSAIVTESMNANGCAWADVDNDGFLDLLVSNWQGPANALFLNNGNGTFTRAKSGPIATTAGECIGAAWADYDGNGFPDLCVANYGGANLLFRNQGNANHWIKIRLQGATSNRSAIGARIRVKAMIDGTERWQMREIRGAQGWGDQGLEALFGLGSATTAAEVLIEWPSGLSSRLTEVAADQIVTPSEPPPLLAILPAQRFFNQSVTVSMLTPIPDGQIRYTLDGAAPEPGSTLYSAPFVLEETTTVKARVYTNNLPASDTVAVTFTNIARLPAVVVPQGLTNVAGGQNSSLFSGTRRIQQIYGPANFPAGQVTISELRFRPGTPIAAVSANLTDLRVFLSTSSRQPDALSSTFAENSGPDVTEVFAGPLNLVASGTGTPGGATDFEFAIPLIQPFFFDPAKGNLLVELHNGTPTGGLTEDATGSTSDQASRVFDMNSGSATAASTVDSYASVLALGYLTKPPALWMAPAPGTYNNPIRIVLNSPVAGGEIRYTLDGSEPTAASSLYTAPFRLENTATLQASVFVNGSPVSPVVTGTFDLPVKRELNTLVAPPQYAATEDPLGGWDNVLSAPIRIQQVYAASHFPNLPIWIRELHWRAKPGEKASTASLPDFDLRLSTTAKSPNGLSSTFAENVGTDEVVVLKGRVDLETNANGPAAGPNPFDLLIRFRTPFLYDPSKGNLLVDIRNRAGSWGPLLSASADFNDNASRAFALSPDATSAFATDQGAEVIEFGYVENPPAIWVSPVAGAYDHSIDVRMLTDKPNSVIRYTLDGSDPGPASPAYAASFKLSTTATLKARTYVDALPVSDIWTSAYQITLTPPVITTELKTSTVIEGTPVTVNATVTGSPPLLCQWYRNDVAVTGATSPILNLGAVKLDQAGTYTLRVTNEVSTTAKALLELTVNPKPVLPTFTRQPESQTAVVGSTVVFIAEATGTPPLVYEWRDRFQRVIGNSPTLTLSNVQKADAGSYVLRVTNAAGPRVSNAATLTVVDAPIPPAITSTSSDSLVPEGTLVTLFVRVTGTSPLTYQWFFNGQPIPGADRFTLSFPSVKLTQAGTYTVLITNPVGQAVSRGVVLDVNPLDAGGNVNLANRLTAAGIDAPVTDADGTTRLAGTAFLAQLYVGAQSDNLAPAGGAVPFNTGDLAGYVTPRNRVLTQFKPGDAVFAQIRAWESVAGGSYESALANGGKAGTSAVISVIAGQYFTPANLVGLQAFSVRRESTPPSVTIDTPVAGVTHDERFTLGGSAADNLSLSEVRWEWDGVPQGALTVNEGHFAKGGLRLHRGDNHIRVIAADRAGNIAEASTTVRWDPVRTLALTDATPHLEGQLVPFNLSLESPGDVLGLSFLIEYPPDWFRDPEFDWATSLAAGIRQFNFEAPGRLRGTFAASQPLPAGLIDLGLLGLRARSVPETTSAKISLTVLDMSDAQGNPYDFGLDARSASVTVVPRVMVGDNNGNRRLDIGDATLIQRLLVNLDPVRPWDIQGNDLNQSQSLDSGDIVKVLRVVVGVDPQPPGAGGVALAGGDDEAAFGTFSLQADRIHAAPGETVTVQVRIAGLTRAISGATFSFKYPALALRLVNADSMYLGLVAPGNALSLWNVLGGFASPVGQVNCAISSPNAWPVTNGVLAELKFLVLPQADRVTWPLLLAGIEVTDGAGYDLHHPADAALPLNPLPQLMHLERAPDGVTLICHGEAGLDYTLEGSSDLRVWTTIQSASNTSGVMIFTDTTASGVPTRYYRVREGR